MSARKEKPFASEAELCAAFTAWAQNEGWTVYAETAGWDMLLVNASGAQLGVEAKLDLNLKVIAQVLKDNPWREESGPDHRAILVPCSREGIDGLLAFAGIAVFTPERGCRERGWSFRNGPWRGFDELFDWNPKERCKIPEYVPDVEAGVPGPRTLSPWKVGALRVFAILEVQGFVTRDDIRECHIDPRRWCASDGWLVPIGQGRWSHGKAPRFDEQHPTIFAQVLAETRARFDAMKAAA